MSVYDVKAWRLGYRGLTADERFVIALPFAISCLVALLGIDARIVWENAR